MEKLGKREMAALYRKAKEAGLAAGEKAVPPVMIVSEADFLGRPIPGGKSYEVPSGPCGFAWVNVKPGSSSFARWLVKNEFALKSYYGGVDIWVRDFGQSMMKKEAAAGAMADVLRAAGIVAYPGSRMD